MAASQVWDTIVIGSGIGGLAAASALAKVGKQRVLVLEKHSERGGLTHVFRRDGASWDVGVHYLGRMEAGSRVRQLFDFFSGGALSWNKMPDDFERFVYTRGGGSGDGGTNNNPAANNIIDFTVPSDRHKYLERLAARFPDEAPALSQYFSDLSTASKWNTQRVMESVTPKPLSSIVGALRRRGDALATQTTAQYLDAHFRSAELKALLASQWPDYGLPPAESAFVLHAVVVWSYANGGWFPDGGAGRIARTFEAGIEAEGGCVKVCHEVTGILTDGAGAVSGVRAIDRRGVGATEVEFKSRRVVSNVGAELTYNTLLPTDGEVGRRTGPLRELIGKLKGGPSAVVLYLRLSKHISNIGLKGENYWINTTLNHDDLDAQTEAVLGGKPQHIYMSFPSAKSGDDRFHTAEILAIVRGDGPYFEAWQKTEHGMRGHEYLDLKDRIASGLLGLAETVTPGLSDLVEYQELSTPLSMIDYTSHPTGSIYGLRGSPERYRSGLLNEPSPIPGLYLSGQDGLNLGVAGALMGGVVAASRILGSMGFIKITRAAGRKPVPEPAPGLLRASPDKHRAVVVGKKALTPTIYRLDLEVAGPVEYAPGQFLMIKVAPYEWRFYSIAGLASTNPSSPPEADKSTKENGSNKTPGAVVVTLLISSRTGGDGSQFATAASVGDETQVELSFGDFLLRDGAARRKVFLATGTGIAPFLPMFATLAKAGQLDNAELLFGCRLDGDDITPSLVADGIPMPRTTVCLSGISSDDYTPSVVREGRFTGRVTARLRELDLSAVDTEFYLCGSPAMINDCRIVLGKAGVKATRIFTELY